MERSTLNQINDHQNDIGRYLCQLKSTLIAISIDDNVEKLRSEDIQNVLWILADRIEDLEKSNDAQYEIIKRELSNDNEMLSSTGVEAFSFKTNS
jgi:hypothetical protein